MRVGYVCAHPVQLDLIRQRTPPWIVSRLGQRAAVAALDSGAYYQRRYAETHRIRQRLVAFLTGCGFDVVPGACANFVMCRPPPGIAAQAVQAACARCNVYIRLVDEGTLRLAVVAPDSLPRMQGAIEAALALTR